MAFTPKNWQDTPSVATPITALAIEDIEIRLSDYTDDLLVPVTGGMPLVANDFGVVADGTTDDTAAWEAIITSLIDGQAVTWYGNSKVQPGLTFQGRVTLIGQSPLRSAFTISGGTTTNDGIIFGGTDGPRYGHVLRDFTILGGVSCCDNALLLQNLVDSQVNVWIKAGATGYGASVEGCLNAKLMRISVSANAGVAYSGTMPANGIRVVGSSLLPSNANRFAFITEGCSGDGFVGDATVGAAGSFNNYLTGVSQGNGGRNVALEGWKEFSVVAFHNEASTGTELQIEDCQRGQIGPGVFVDGTTAMVNCDDVKLAGLTTTNLTIDSACARTHRDGVFINGGTDTDSSFSSWQNATLEANWGTFSASFNDPGYRLVRDRVELRGMGQITSGSLPNMMFTLPSGLRPAKYKTFTVESNDLKARIQIQPDGVVNAQSGGSVGGGNFWALEGVSFEL